MSEDPEIAYERAAIQHMTRRLEGVAHGFSLGEAITQEVVRTVVADMPLHGDEERLAEARARMIAASA